MITGVTARLVALLFWFDRIEFRANGGSNLMATIYEDVLFPSLVSIEDEQFPGGLQGCNMSKDWKPLPSYAQNTNITFHLPLVGFWVDTGNINRQH